MINYDSILSVFDGKPTLLQWLKLIKKALDESVLKDITLKQDGTSVVFTFNFEDGTSLSTPAVTLPKGDTGAKGDKGDTGVSVTGVDEVSNEVVGAQTLTTLRFNFSNGTNNEVVVHAENGKNASGGKLYLHKLNISNSGQEKIIKLLFINTDSGKITSITPELLYTSIKSNMGIKSNATTTYYECREVSSLGDNIMVDYYTTYPFATASTNSEVIKLSTAMMDDTVTEL